MTREQFEKIEAEKGFKEALSEFAYERDEIEHTESMENFAIEMINMGYYSDAEEVCSALANKTTFTGYWYCDCGDIDPIDSIEDIEDLFE